MVLFISFEGYEMSDLINRQDAIDAINHICPVDTEYDCALLDREDVRYVLSDLPSAEPESKWIPVTERLPEEDKDVLVFGVEAISNEYVYGVKRLDVDTWRPRIAPSIRWIAWMPLPEPWKGEK